MLNLSLLYSLLSLSFLRINKCCYVVESLVFTLAETEGDNLRDDVPEEFANM